MIPNSLGMLKRFSGEKTTGLEIANDRLGSGVFEICYILQCRQLYVGALKWFTVYLRVISDVISYFGIWGLVAGYTRNLKV